MSSTHTGNHGDDDDDDECGVSRSKHALFFTVTLEMESRWRVCRLWERWVQTVPNTHIKHTRDVQYER